jgi:alpha-glucosidase
MDFPFVPVNQFTPNSPSSPPVWITPGNIDSVTPNLGGRNFTFAFGQRSLVISVLGPTAFRLRFNPAPNADYNSEYSIAVVQRDLGLQGMNLTQPPGHANQLILDTGVLRIQIGLQPFAVAVFRSINNQLIHADAPGSGVLFIPGDEVTAVMKTAPPGAFYFGCGEKAGSQLLKNNFTFANFNFDNFTYNGPSLGTPGPLNPSEPLYCSIPLLIEHNPSPSGPYSGGPYAYGVFLDNVGQSFINVTTNDYSNMTGKYYLGALYNELDYYFMAGDNIPDVLRQYTTLTGRAPMPPRYAFGLHQGAYGYFDHIKLSNAANAYRNNRIPCDGLHIDVDFQDNYRTFTHSEIKFPNAKQLFSDLHANGFKMSTNITPIITDNELDETGQTGVYAQRQALSQANALIPNARDGQPPANTPYLAGVNYGFNRGNNPYVAAYPPLMINLDGLVPLTAPGNYPDFGLASVRKIWGMQYDHLLNDLGLGMI